jgi:hypothetical protein
VFSKKGSRKIAVKKKFCFHCFSAFGERNIRPESSSFRPQVTDILNFIIFSCNQHRITVKRIFIVKRVLFGDSLLHCASESN